MNWIKITTIALTIAAAFISIYISLESQYQVQLLEERIETLYTKQEKIDYFISNTPRPQKDTIILNINNKVETTNVPDTMIIRFTNR